MKNGKTLNAGDVTLTGSPVGAEFIGAGEIIEYEIKGIGTLRNSFVSSRENVTIVQDDLIIQLYENKKLNVNEKNQTA